MKKATKDQIRNVLVLLFSAIACGLLFAAYMLYQYGPTGQYLAGNTILSPSIIDEINYKDNHPGNKNKEIKFVFNGIEFSYFDKVEGRQIKTNPPFSAYEKFYNSVSSNKSLLNIQEQIKKDFALDTPSTFMITMKTDSSHATQITKVFQIIQFLESDYFRVQLYGKQTEGEWAYFYQPHIYQDTLRLFTPNH